MYKVHIIMLALCLYFNSPIFSQSKYKEKVVFELTDSNKSWSVFRNQPDFDGDTIYSDILCNLYFNKNGEYIFKLREQEHNERQLKIKSMERNIGGDSKIYYYTDENDSMLYVRSAYGIKYNKVSDGVIANYSTCKYTDDIAITIIKDNLNTGRRAYFYINNKLVSVENCNDSHIFQKGKLNSVENRLYNQRWCAFSENGNQIYYLFYEGKYILYINGQQIHKSNFPYLDLGITSSGKYFFVEQDSIYQIIKSDNNLKEDSSPSELNYDSIPKYIIHLPDTSLKNVKHIYKYKIMDDGGHYFLGAYNGDDKYNSNFAFINKKLFISDNIGDNNILIDKDNYLIEYNKHPKSTKLSTINEELSDSKTSELNYAQNRNLVINCNNIEYPLSENSIISIPNLNQLGSFAYFNRELKLANDINSFVINAKTKLELKHGGLEINPIYISADGKQFLYETTDNKISTYYQNNQILFVANVNKVNLLQFNYENSYFFGTKNIESYFYQPKSYLYYLRVDTTWYMVYKGSLSKPNRVLNSYELDHFKDSLEDNNSTFKDSNKEYILSSINSVGYNENGFYVIYKKGNSFFVNINNNVYEEIGKIDKIIPDNYFFDSKELIFYGIRQNKVYQFKISEN